MLPNVFLAVPVLMRVLARVPVLVRVRVLVLVLVVRVVVQVYVVGKGGMGGVMVSVWGILPSRQRSTRVIVLP